MALGDDSLLLLHGRYVTVDDGVELFANIIFNVHLVADDFICYCLLESRYFGGIFWLAFPEQSLRVSRFQTNEMKLEKRENDEIWERRTRW